MPRVRQHKANADANEVRVLRCVCIALAAARATRWRAKLWAAGGLAATGMKEPSEAQGAGAQRKARASEGEKMKWLSRTKEAAVTKARANCKGHDKPSARGAHGHREANADKIAYAARLEKTALSIGYFGLACPFALHKLRNTDLPCREMFLPLVSFFCSKSFSY